MAYKLFDKNGDVVTNSDLQNRSIWYRHGESKEDIFVNEHRNFLNISINPEKTKKKTVPDLIFNENLTDLKCQNTPLFQANERYDIDSQYAVTFNLKDALNYGQWGKNYSSLYIIFWIDWVAVEMKMTRKDYEVESMTGVWGVPFSQLEKMRMDSPIHWYNQRGRLNEDDPTMRSTLRDFEPRLVEGTNVQAIRGYRGNAACSYVFDLQNFERLDV